MDLSNLNFSVVGQQIALMAAIFLASVAVLNVCVFKPTLAILKEREKRLTGTSQNARALQEDIQKKIFAYEAQMTQVRQSAKQARDILLKSGETEHQQIITAAREYADQAIGDAKKEIQTSAAKAREKLSTVTASLANEMANKILGKKVA